MFRILITYTGNVQGVGFRWQVLNIAKSFPITGYVKNLSTGQVEVLVEGKRKICLEIIKEIDEKLKGFWLNKGGEIKGGDAHYKNFKIKYY